MHAEAGIDYLTTTIDASNPDFTKYIAIGHKLQKEEHNEGNSLKPSVFMGYEGTTCGSVFVGTNYVGGMVRVDGFPAGGAFKALQKVDCKTTRIDLQVTVWYDSDPAEIIRNYHKVAVADAQVTDERTKRKIRGEDINDGGYCIYIGARTSAYFGRLYDKWREAHSEVFKYALRFEVEIKQERAQQAVHALKSRKGDKTEAICAFVGEWYTARGIRVPFLYAPAQMVLEPISREKSDTARRLEWLRTQVRPTIFKLREHVDEQVILEVLGFFEPLSGQTDTEAPGDALNAHLAP